MTVASTVISIVVTATSASSCMDPLLRLSVRQPGGAQLSQVREPFSVPALAFDQNRVGFRRDARSCLVEMMGFDELHPHVASISSRSVHRDVQGMEQECARLIPVPQAQVCVRCARSSLTAANSDVRSGCGGVAGYLRVRRREVAPIGRWKGHDLATKLHYQSRLFAKAWPEPDFKYFSKALAFPASEDAT
jgi:hypothetical protein